MYVYIYEELLLKTPLNNFRLLTENIQKSF